MARITPPEDHLRFAEWMKTNYGRFIHSKEDYDRVFDEQMNPESGSNVDTTFRENTWKVYSKKTGIDEFTRAGGKSLKMDRLKTARIVLPRTKEGLAEYRRLKAQHANVSGIDTKDAKTVNVKWVKQNRELKYPARVKMRTVYTSKEMIGEKVVFRDRGGRFASRKK